MGHKIGDEISKVFRGLHFRFFWQLIVAFIAVILFVGGGIFWAGRSALREVETFARDNPPPMARPWGESLASYYEENGGWEGVDSLIVTLPGGEFEKQGWYTDYILAASDGTIVASSAGEQIGRSLHYGEKRVSFSIEVNDQTVGYLLLSPYGRFRDDFGFIVGSTLQRFLLIGLAIGAVALITAGGLSRVISHPVVRLTEATRAVAGGDLGVRVPGRYPGELGELAASFNVMTEELARADNLRRNMTADVAHELRTPLSVIRGKVEGVLDGVMKNVVSQTATSAMLVPAVTNKSADVALAYDTDARSEAGRTDVVRIDSEHTKAIQPFAIAKTSEHKELARRLFQAIAATQETFEAAGFGWRMVCPAPGFEDTP